jgi:hypothetical protein
VSALEGLIREGFFNHPNKRTREQVVKASASTGLSTKGKEKNITNALAGRVKRGVLKKVKVSSEWVYWTE